MDKEKDMVTAQEAAKIKGLHIKSVYLAIQTGRLKAEKFYGRVLIDRKDLDTWQPVGHRPRKQTDG